MLFSLYMLCRTPPPPPPPIHRASQAGTSLTLPAPRRQPFIAYSMNARRERVWDTTVPRFVLAPPELGWATIG